MEQIQAGPWMQVSFPECVQLQMEGELEIQLGSHRHVRENSPSGTRAPCWWANRQEFGQCRRRPLEGDHHREYAASGGIFPLAVDPLAIPLQQEEMRPEKKPILKSPAGTGQRQFKWENYGVQSPAEEMVGGGSKRETARGHSIWT